MKKTISIRIGKGSISHNNRKFVAKNVDEKRVNDNVILCCENLKDVYDDLFGAALAEYNSKQKRKDRRIENYLDHIENGKQEKPFYELIFQIGNKDDTPCGSCDADIATEILREYYDDFLKRNPHIRVFNAVIHLDEATPHLHVDFVPFATGQSRGLSTRNSLSKALEQQGFSAKTNLETPAKQWTDFEKQRLSMVMKKRGIEWEQLGTHNEHLSVLDFKKQEREKEVKKLDGEIGNKELILEWRQQAVTEAEAIIDKIDAEYQEKSSVIEQLNSEISEKENTLAETTAAVTENQELIALSAKKVIALKEVDKIQTKKTLFGDNVTVSQTDYDNLSNLAKKQIAAESKENSLQSRITVLETENQNLNAEKEQLTKQNAELRNENGRLQSVYGQIAISKLRSERDNLQRKLDRVMEFIKSLGLLEKLQKFLKPDGRKFIK